MPEQLIDTRFPGQQFSVGSVATFPDRHQRTVFQAVTELRRQETIVAGGDTSRWRVRYAGLQLITAGPTVRTRDRRAQPRIPRHVADSRLAHRVHGVALQHRHTQPEAVDGGVPPVPRPVVPSTPDGDSAPTLDLTAVPLARRLEN